MNKTLHKIQIGLLVISITLLQSCEALLDIDLPDNQIQRKEIFYDVTTTNAALINLYANARETSIFNGGIQGIGQVLSLYTDELISNNPTSSFGNYGFYTNTINDKNGLIRSFWTSSYKHTYAINSFIEGVQESINLLDSDKRFFLSEAYFLRAFYYQSMTNLYGNIPYTTTSDYNINKRLPKTSHSDILLNVEKDLIQALSLSDYTYRNVERIYPNKATIELLLAKNYLLLNQPDKAEYYSKKVIDNPLYHLEEDLNNVFKKNARSTIWQFSTNNSSTLEARNYIITTAPPRASSPVFSESFLQNFEPSDLRLNKWINTVSSGSQTWHYPYKYKNRTNNISSDEYSIIFRIEEAYLLYAESLIMQDKIMEAIPYINKIKHRASASKLPLSTDKQTLVKELLIENQREFFCEHGHRFFTLKRNRSLNILKNYKPNWEDKHQLLPFPESETLLNTNLIPNNYGY